MNDEEDTRPKILLSDLIEKVVELSKGRRPNYVEKIKSVVIALASIGSGKLGAVKGCVKKLKLTIGADSYGEVNDILGFLREKDIVEKQGKIYRLTYWTVPQPHLKNIKKQCTKEIRYISDLFDRVSKLRTTNFVMKEPALALASISLLSELRVFLVNLKSIVTEESTVYIRDAVLLIEKYQQVLEYYHQEEEMPENEGRVFCELELVLTDLYTPPSEETLRKKGPYHYTIGKLYCVRASLRGGDR